MRLDFGRWTLLQRLLLLLLLLLLNGFVPSLS